MPDLWMNVDAALTELPVNILPLIDDTDFKSIEIAIAWNEAGMSLDWNFVTTAGVHTQNSVVPTTAGDYDWAHAGGGMYTIEMPASGGASANNDTEGVGWFSGVCTGVLPWRGPTIGFRAAALNDALIDGGDTLDVNVTEIAAAAVTDINEGAAIHVGNCPAGSTYNNILLEVATSSAVNDYYNECIVTIVAGTGAGQARLIADYVGSTHSAVVRRAWVTAPADDSDYRIYPFSGILLANTGQAAAATSTTITLPAPAPAIADTYIGHTIFISGGTAVGQARIVTAYTNTRIATVSPAWTTTPDTTSIYLVLPVGRTFVNAMATDAISAAAISAAGANKLADHVIRRTFQNACDSSDGDPKNVRSLLGATGKAVNRLAASGGTLTIYEDDDTTPLGTQTITTDAGASPIIELNTD
jgi:hypothetical protein